MRVALAALDLLALAVALVLGVVAYARTGFTAEVVLWAVLALWASSGMQTRLLSEKIDAAARRQEIQMKVLLEGLEERTRR